MRALVLGISACVFLGGCGTVAVYTLDTTKINSRVFIDGEGPLAVRSAYIYQDGADCKGMVATRVREWISIRPNEPFTVTAIGAHGAGGNTIRSCQANITFQPEAGKDYVVKYGGEGDRCTAGVYKLSGSSSEAPAPVRMSLRKFVDASGTGSWCGAPIE